MPIEHVRLVTQTPEAQSTSSPPAAESQASCPAVFCRWRNEGDPAICGAVISCEGVPAHFKSAHGIKRVNETTPVVCRWEGCYAQVVRKNFVRHIRQCRGHLGHIRDKGHMS
jgi:hypothetical protein